DKAKAEFDKAREFADEKTSPVVQEYNSRIKAAEEILDITRREEQRLRELAEKKAASWADHDRALDRLKTAWSELEAVKSQRVARGRELKMALDVAEAAHKTAQWNLEQQTLRSPIDGVVLDRPLSLQTRVAIND